MAGVELSAADHSRLAARLGTESGALDLGIPAVLVPRGGDDADQVLYMIANWISS